MATTPVRIRDDDKAQLEQLRRAMQAATGERPTQQEALGRAIEFALRNKGQFVSEGTWKPLTPKQFRHWVASVEKSAGWKAARPHEIDDVVYGERGR